MISYAITVKDELHELTRLMFALTKHGIKKDDEIIVLWDDKGDIRAYEFINSMSLEDNRIKVYQGEFDMDFSKWKNKLNNLCTQPWIFNIDADEVPDKSLVDNIHEILELNNDNDLIYVPRINFVNDIGLSWVQKWGWKITCEPRFTGLKNMNLENPIDLDHFNLLVAYGLVDSKAENEDGTLLVRFRKPIINAFDFQGRIYKNSKDIWWSGMVHEQITGCKNITKLPPESELFLFHEKDITRQIKQNELYTQIPG